MPGAAAKRLPTTKSVLEIARDVQSAIWTEISATIIKGLKSLLEGLLEDQEVDYEQKDDEPDQRENPHAPPQNIHGPIGRSPAVGIKEFM